MDKRLYFLLAKTENAMSVYVKKQLLSAGLKVSTGQLGILFLLKKNDMQTMSELSTAIETDNSAITRAIDRLEKSGLVIRQYNEKDRREIRIKITEEGFSETENAKIVISDLTEKIGKKFTKDELNSFNKVLIKMNSMFREERG